MTIEVHPDELIGQLHQQAYALQDLTFATLGHQSIQGKGSRRYSRKALLLAAHRAAGAYALASRLLGGIPDNSQFALQIIEQAIDVAEGKNDGSIQRL